MTKNSFAKMKEYEMYDTADVACGYDYWFFKLLNYCLGIYQYDGLPKTLPGRELLMNLLLTGHAVIFHDPGKKNLITTKTQLVDFDEYYRPTKAVYGNVEIKSKTLYLGVDSEVVYLDRIEGNVLMNQAVDSGLKTFICRYARQLADVESTANIYMVNIRNTSFPVASDDQTKQQVEGFFRRLILGKRAVITDNIVQESFRNVDYATTRSNDSLNDILIARDKILANFFQDIGIKYRQEQKKAQMTEDEIETDEQLLMLDVNQMKEVQQEGLDRVNNMFGTNIRVKINPLYDRNTYRRKEGGTDGSTENTVQSDTE